MERLNDWGIGQSYASVFLALSGNMIVNILWVLRSTVEDSAPLLTLNITDNMTLIASVVWSVVVYSGSETHH